MNIPQNKLNEVLFNLGSNFYNKNLAYNNNLQYLFVLSTYSNSDIYVISGDLFDEPLGEDSDTVLACCIRIYVNIIGCIVAS